MELGPLRRGMASLTKAMHSAVERKWARFQRGGRLRALDLFAGAGGLSLGFHAAGFELLAGVESDPDAAFTHGSNFFGAKSPDDVHAVARDITKTMPKRLFRDLGLSGPAGEHVDVIIGGPPCQAFARVGRAKLREVAEHPEAFLRDPRAQLYASYIEYVKECQPLALVMENVPDILNYGGQNIAEQVCSLLEQLGYKVKYSLLNSVYYGVPQMRERMVLVAIHSDVPADFVYPVPSHRHELPAGYRGSRAVALQGIRGGASCDSRYEPAPAAPLAAPPAVTAEGATSDLPAITLHLEGRLKRGARRFTERLDYASGPVNDYQNLMRTWDGFPARSGVYDHVIRYLPRDYPTFAAMQPGDQYPEAHKVAERRFLEALSGMGKKPTEGSPGWESLREQFVPPYSPRKFPNKWRKMEADAPARTLMAHLGKDSYSHIHYDSTQARTISVREAARLQSFPDGFVFKGTMNPAFRQIGNAVPPVMACAVAKQLHRCLAGAHERLEEFPLARLK